MNEKKSFFEKLGRSLQIEDENSEIATPFEGEEESSEEFSDEGNTEETPNEEGVDIGLDLEQEETPRATLAAATTVKKKKIAPKKAPRKKEMQNEEGQLTIDVFETEDAYVIKSTIAGVDSDDLDINITQDSVSIRGVREKDEEVQTNDYFYQECYWGAFSRSIILPTEIDPDHAVAKLQNGILTISLPKLSRSQQKKLKVKAG